MKKFTVLVSAISGYLFTNTTALAADSNATPMPITIQQPGQGIAVGTNLGTVISNVLTIFFTIGVIMVLVFIILGAFDWITSGGEKENVAKARNKILNALIGLAILALAFLIARVGGAIAGINIFNLQIPNLGSTSGLSPIPTP